MSQINGMLGVVTVVGLLAGSSLAQTQSGTTQQPAAAQGNMDQRFVRRAASSGLSEVMLGKLATQRAAAAKVRAFGEHMIADHTKANEELKTLAARKNLALPTTLAPKEQAEVAKLEQLQGAAFDAAYLRQQLNAHVEAVALFERESTRGQDEDLKAFATRTLPVLRKHLEMVRAHVGQGGQPGGTTGTADPHADHKP